MHLGFDLASLKNSPAPAANSGVVAFAGPLTIYGNTVIVDHGLGLQTLYGHLSSLAVKEGDEVKQGQELGRTGTTGLAVGDHLHFEVLIQGISVTPVEWWDGKWIRDHIGRPLMEASVPLLQSEHRRRPSLRRPRPRRSARAGRRSAPRRSRFALACGLALGVPAAGRHRGSRDHAARVRCPVAAGLHPGRVSSDIPMEGKGRLDPRCLPAAHSPPAVVSTSSASCARRTLMSARPRCNVGAASARRRAVDRMPSGCAPFLLAASLESAVG